MGTHPVLRITNAAAPAVATSAVETLLEGGAVSVHTFWWACASSAAYRMRTVEPGASAVSQAVAASVSRLLCHPNWS